MVFQAKCNQGATRDPGTIPVTVTRERRVAPKSGTIQGMERLILVVSAEGIEPSTY
jgi:hypothetical protein